MKENEFHCVRVFLHTFLSVYLNTHALALTHYTVLNRLKLKHVIYQNIGCAFCNATAYKLIAQLLTKY